MKNKILIMIIGIFSLGIMIPNNVYAEVTPTNFEDTIKEEIDTFDGQEGYEDGIEKLKNADLSGYKEKDDKVNVYIFRGNTCSYCFHAITYFTEIIQEYKDKINIITYEVWQNSDNNSLMEQVGKTMNEEVTGVPYIIIGDKGWQGYSEEMNSEITDKINSEYESDDRYDVMDNLVEGTTNTTSKNTSSSSSSTDIIIIILVIALAGLEIYQLIQNKKLKEQIIELQKDVKKSLKSKK